MPNKGALLGLCLLAMCGLATHTQAQTITTLQELNFGTIAIVNNGSVARVTINPNGTFSTNGNAYFYDNPTRGEYQVTGATPNTLYTITITSGSSANLTGPGMGFTFDDMQVTPAVLITNGAGEDIFYISGRLQTQGGGAMYSDGNYATAISLVMAY